MMLAAYQTSTPSFCLGVIPKADYTAPKSGGNNHRAVSMAKQGRMGKVLKALASLYDETPIKTNAVAEEMRDEIHNTTRWLNEAEQLGLCKNVRISRKCNSIWILTGP